MPEEKALTNSEKEIMELMWKVERPLSGAEIVSLSEDKTWKESYIHLLINSLLKKEVIKMEGFIRTKKNYARTFVPCFSEKEYCVRLLTKNSSFKKENVPYIINAILENVSDKGILNEVAQLVNAKL